MKYNLEGKIFRSTLNSENGDVTSDTLFHYHQDGNVVSAEHEGGSILKGHLLGKILDNGEIDARYHHIQFDGTIMTGKCLSTPQKLPDGTLKFKEQWQWLSGDMSSGYSEIEEVGNL